MRVEASGLFRKSGDTSLYHTPQGFSPLSRGLSGWPSSSSLKLNTHCWDKHHGSWLSPSCSLLCFSSPPHLHRLPPERQKCKGVIWPAGLVSSSPSCVAKGGLYRLVYVLTSRLPFNSRTCEVAASMWAILRACTWDISAVEMHAPYVAMITKLIDGWLVPYSPTIYAPMIYTAPCRIKSITHGHVYIISA